MKHMSILHGQVRAGTFVAPAAVAPSIALESAAHGNIAMEGMWDTIKQFAGFDDESRANKKIAELNKFIKDMTTLKTTFSQKAGNQTVTAELAATAASLPISGKNGAEVVKNMVLLRKQLAAQVDALDKASTPEAVEKAKSFLKELKGRESTTNLDRKLTFTKQDVLGLLDEVIAMTQLEIKVYQHGIAAKKKADQSNASMESYALALEGIALESFGNKFIAVVIGYFGYGALISKYIGIVGSIVLLAMGMWPMAVLQGLYVVVNHFVSEWLIPIAKDFWNRE